MRYPLYERTKAIPRTFIIRSRDHRNRSPMKVAMGKNNFCLIFSRSFNLIGPLPAELHGGFNSFHSRIHNQSLIVSEKRTDKLFEISQFIIIKCPRGKCQFPGLNFQRIDNPGMTMALVHRRISRKKIIIFISFHIP
ncbi:hypothetical protein D3C78_1514590 [compost metagenome]